MKDIEGVLCKIYQQKGKVWVIPPGDEDKNGFMYSDQQQQMAQ